MSLCVNAALKRTRGGYVCVAHRGNTSSKPLSLLTCENYHVRPRCRQHTSLLTNARLTRQPAHSYSSQTCRSSLNSDCSTVKLPTDQIYPYAECPHTDISNGRTALTSPIVRSSGTEGSTPSLDLSSTSASATQSQVAFQSVSSTSQHQSGDSLEHSFHNESAIPTAENLGSHHLYLRNTESTNGGNGPLHEPRTERSRSPTLDTRRIPREFQDNLEKLRVLLSERRGIQYIRTVFGDIISAKDDLIQIHGDAPRAWLNGPWTTTKASQILNLVLGSILTSPRQAITVLQCLNEIHLDFLFRARCLSFIGQIHKDALGRESVLMIKFQEEVSKLRSPERWPVYGIRRRDLSLMLWGMNHAEAEQLIQLFLQRYPSPQSNVQIWLAMYCARHRMDSLALHLLTSLPAEELQTPTPLVLQCCHVLLGHDVVESTAEGTNFKLLPRLLEHGLTPDSMLYSRIIERAIESGYPGVAWDVFRHLQSNKISVTGWTFFLLLRHAFNENNVNGVQEIMSQIQRDDALLTNLPLLHYSMNIVRRISYYESAMTTAESLSHILALYDRVFSREPLKVLGILPRSGSTNLQAEGSRARPEKAVNQPDAYSLSFTVWAYVLCYRSGKHAQMLWRRIQELVGAGDTTVLECMEHDLIYNAFIWLNLRESRTMADALEIFRYMLAKQLCMPTDRTWSILICGFLRHNQKAQAQHIFELMKQCNLGLGDIRREYWRRQWTFQYFEEHLEEILDEGKMPDGTEAGDLLATQTAKAFLARSLPEFDLQEDNERKPELI